MAPPQNILDELVEAALEYEFFPKNTRFTKRHFNGAHGPSSTSDVLVELSDGNTYRLVAHLEPERGQTRQA
ncbi:hypothetical protein IB265_33000 [Ensifer sp. ENS10]|uniref:hypothetical protein n=1 Tax=Ensifer sp. ENS10 TaxID=2769286 RepID=UPI00177D2040|nr:hypothetical protein [Ensifer sp. ENS10]MBD9511576.1 hypothetical protein [Ensifer sp. ENS10]